MNSRYFVTFISDVPGTEYVTATQADCTFPLENTMEKNIILARDTRMDLDGCTESCISSVTPLCGKEDAEEGESRYVFLLFGVKEEDDHLAKVVLCRKTIPHKEATWDDMMAVQKQVTEEYGFHSASIFAANRLPDTDGENEGGGADGTE